MSYFKRKSESEKLLQVQVTELKKGMWNTNECLRPTGAYTDMKKIVKAGIVKLYETY